MNRFTNIVMCVVFLSGCSIVVGGVLDDKEGNAPDANSGRGDAGPDSRPDSRLDSGLESGPGDAAPDVQNVCSENGANCGPGGQICVAGACVTSRCGDGYVDDDNEELCDDGNEVDGDGCDTTCVFSCSEDAMCDDEDPCNGQETCTGHRCISGTAPIRTDTVSCMILDGTTGSCAGGLCAPMGCGNAIIDGSEMCDDGNENNEDGCRSNCTSTCSADADCSDGDLCNGEERCDLSNPMVPLCVTGTPLVCNDADDCTADTCDAMIGCESSLIDEDGDGYAPHACTTDGRLGGDCNDMDGTINPGAAELCDAVDHDCSGAPDNDIVQVDCLRDADMDGYGNPEIPMSACSCPAGYIPPRADGRIDCDDALGSARPDQIQFFQTSRPGGSYDYDCDGTDRQHYTMRASTCGPPPSGHLLGCTGSGWVGEVPLCGESGVFHSCGLRNCSTTNFTRSSRRQGCR